ncbi:Zn(II)2Cys6 transcription factor [Aspergillus mulundensis]|uniref:Putative Zn(II)2Cys6 transcription factor n=1 Tax=Aspergillus mulundensis TaxID=1810919 RepID=A0A3D8QMS8_9EURO|nr:putative Zn(II)2Cys6 transcription factor [Aspergillus mulundensis]RDW63087.1 putative Zn(II)2Cys6 transcription factor [Aspergillus mulundensis]
MTEDCPQNPTGCQRSRTGCFTCRRRKKKCDEIHPICGGCARNHLPCQWVDHVYPTARRPRRRAHQTRFWPRGVAIPQELDGMVTVFAVPSRPILYRLLAHFTDCSPLWMSISPGRRRSQFLRHIIPTALGQTLTMDCLLAVAAGDLMKYEMEEPELRMIALELYGKAVAGLRTAISEELASCAQTCSSDGIVLAVLLLCVHETHNFSDTSRLLPHLNAAAFLLKQRISLAPPDPDLRAFLLEVFCYFFSLTAFSHGPSLILDLAAQIFDSIDHNTTQSLLLGQSQDLIITIFRVTRLAKDLPCMPGPVLAELANIEAQLANDQMPGTAGEAYYDDDRVMYELYRLSCLIYVKQTMDPLLPPRDAELQDIVDHFVAQLDSLPHDSPSNGLLAWPLVITGFYAVAPPHQRIILARLRLIYKTWRTDIFPQTVDYLRQFWGLGSVDKDRYLDCDGDDSRLPLGFRFQNLHLPTVLV